MNSPSASAEYDSLVQVRHDIDRIDHETVSLISQRAQCVKAAVRFKNEQQVAAPDRVITMLEAQRQWARSLDLDPDMIEELYRNMIHRFIEVEKNG